MRGARNPDEGVLPPDGQSGRAPGLLDSARRLVSTLLEVAQTRFALLAVEVQEEGLRLSRLIALAFAAVFFAALGILLGTGYFILLLWQQFGLAVIGVFALVYIGIGMAFGYCAYRKSQEHSQLFQASLAELGKDRERLAP